MNPLETNLAFVRKAANEMGDRLGHIAELDAILFACDEIERLRKRVRELEAPDDEVRFVQITTAVSETSAEGGQVTDQGDGSSYSSTHVLYGLTKEGDVYAWDDDTHSWRRLRMVRWADPKGARTP